VNSKVADDVTVIGIYRLLTTSSTDMAAFLDELMLLADAIKAYLLVICGNFN
jgi:hypothetical protein